MDVSPPAAGASGLPAALGLPDLIDLSLAQNPALQQAALAIDAAQGRALQAGLYPNPTLDIAGEELGDRIGPGGLISAPVVSQEIVRGGKLRLSRAVARKEVDQAVLGLTSERFSLFTVVRQGYFEVLAAQRRVDIYRDLVQLSTQSYENSLKLLNAKEVARLDVLPFKVDLNRFQVEYEAAQLDLVAAWKRLATSMGTPDLPCTQLIGSLEGPMPDYSYCQAETFILAEHPDVLAARVGIERGQLYLQRQRVEPIPNITVAGGFMRDNINRSNEGRFLVNVPIPILNRNQGNIQTASAQLAQANQEVSRVANNLLWRLATAFGQYSTSRRRVEQYRSAIQPTAHETYKLALEAYKGGQFEYLRVLQAQRMLAEADLEYNRALAEAWKAASELAGLLLEEHWPQPNATSDKMLAPREQPKD